MEIYTRKNIPSTPARRFAKMVLQVLGLHEAFLRIRSSRKYNKLHKARSESILEYKRKFDLKIFIETGTFKGEMLDEMLSRFDSLYSIELGDSLYADAVKKFSGESKVKIFHGDSAVVLPDILSSLKEPALFWLDAHFSGGETARAAMDTPIEQELREILAHPIRSHVILIDDAREFTGANGYPSLQTIQKMAQEAGYGYEMKNDNIRLFPGK